MKRLAIILALAFAAIWATPATLDTKLAGTAGLVAGLAAID